MAYGIDGNNPYWGGLIARPGDRAWIGAYRILPGTLDFIKAGHASYHLQDHVFRCVEDNVEFSSKARPDYYDACGQEVVAIVYEQPDLSRTLLGRQKKDHYFTYAAAVIGLRNGHVILDGKYMFWKGEKGTALEKRKKLLTDLITLFVERRSEFAPFFAGGTALTGNDDGLL